MAIKYQVFERTHRKWVQILEPTDEYPAFDCRWTTEQASATWFDLVDLMSADKLFPEFTAHVRSMHAVPNGSNMAPMDCPTVRATIVKNCYVDFD